MNLDELKKKLLAALPPVVREKLGVKLEDEEYDEEDEDIDADEATASHELGEADEEDVEEGEEEEVDDEETAKKAKKSKIIRYIVIGAIVLGILDEFMPGDEEEIVIPDVQVTRPKRPPVETAPETAVEVTPEVVAEETPIQEETPADLEFENAQAVVEETPAAVATEPAFNFDENEFKAETETAIEIPPETAAEVLVPTPVAETSSNDESDTSSNMDKLFEAVDKTTEMAEKEAAKVKTNRDDPSYIAPPNYSRIGRGLVYNCRDGHWACVDKFTYFTCYENQKWNERNNQSTECVTRDVYASVSDCSAIQKFYVNKPEPTDFCSQDSIQTEETKPVDVDDDISNILTQ